MTTRRALPPVVLGAVILVAWQLGVRYAQVSPSLLVPPSEIWRVIGTTYPLLLRHALPTGALLIASFAAATALGVGLGIAMTASQRVRQAIYPHIVMFQLVPKIAVAPLFIIWLGAGAASSFAFATFLAFFPVLVATVTGLGGTDRNSLLLCRALAATKWQTFRFVRLPYALPHIFDGMKVAATLSLTGLVVGEFVAAQSGLGYLVVFGSSVVETGLVFAAIAFLCILGLALYGLVVLAQHLVVRSLEAVPTPTEF